MDKNTVVLSLDDYMALREFKETVEKGWRESKTASVTRYWGNDGCTVKFYTDAEIVYTLEQEIKELKENLDAMKDEKYDALNKLSRVERQLDGLVDQLKHISMWQFNSWKKSHNLTKL